MTQELIEVNDALSEARLASGCGQTAEAVNKGGFEEAFAAGIGAEIDALVAPGATGGQDFEAFEQAARS